MGKVNRHSPEFRERAVRLLREHRHEYKSDWQALSSIAEKVGCSRESLRRWAQQSEVDAGQQEGVTSAERERLAELEKEVRELRRANEILRKASLGSTGHCNTVLSTSTVRSGGDGLETRGDDARRQGDGLEAVARGALDERDRPVHLNLPSTSGH